MTTKQSVPAIPLLSQKHNGIPANLYAKAQHAKSAIFETATKAMSNRTEIALPQGIGESAFHKAIEELRGHLGKEHVELVTKLDDGW